MDLTRTPDEFVLKQLRDNFGHITGETRPVDKGSNKNEDKGPEEWFQQLSFMHFMFFERAFLEAKRRGIMNVAEIAAGQEIIDMLPRR